jgi:hypothetical protein
MEYVCLGRGICRCTGQAHLHRSVGEVPGGVATGEPLQIHHHRRLSCTDIFSQLVDVLNQIQCYCQSVLQLCTDIRLEPAHKWIQRIWRAQVFFFTHSMLQNHMPLEWFVIRSQLIWSSIENK